MSTLPSLTSLTNRTIKGYEFHEQVGAGGFGEVYRAFQASVGREVAIKVILPKHANQPDFIRRFEVEAQVIARLEHPHIVPMYDYWRDPNGAFLVMRWLRGSLRTSIQNGAWSLENAARLLDQIAGALAIAHREGIIHRDLKPDNILLDEDDNAYLADFGIAKNIHLRDPNQTGEGQMVGSPAYLSPEQIRSQELTARSDLYSMGYVLYELLTGHKPLDATSTANDYIHYHLSKPLPMLSIEDSRIPAAVDEVLQTATAKDPSHRYPSAQRFAAAFRAALPNRLPRIPAQPLVDALTERELEVLKLMVADLTNQQIAERLFLTPGTVKWYVKQIYGKLDVHSRQQAVDRASSLRLLDHPAASAFPDSIATPAQDDHPTLKGADLLPAVEPDNPYKGLRAFQEADAADFFGRAALTEHLLSRLSEEGDAERFLAIVGPSGSGKSSAVRAGLIPALRSGALKSAPRPFVADFMPGSHPLEELEAALLRVAVQPVPGLLEQLREDRRGLVRAAKRLLPSDGETELILVVDQFEETFTLVEDEATRIHFIDNLLAAAADPRGRVRIVLTLRADFYDRPLMYPRLAEMVRSHTEVITPLTAREMEQAIIAPAERVGLRVEPGLVATILKDVGEQPGTLPLLQFTLTELFERREGLTLTHDAYKASGGVLGALGRRADDLFNTLDADARNLARQVFLRLVTLGEGVEDTRRRAMLAELHALSDEGAVDDVLDLFAAYRLLTLDRDPLSHGPTVEIAHEALIREWGRLREWLTSSREDIRVQRRLAQAAAEWNSGRDTSYLASGARLSQFENWAIDTNLALTTDERAFLDASLAERTRSERIEAERRAHEQQLERRSRNILRTLVGVLLAATIGAFGLTGIAVDRSNAEQTARATAERGGDELRSVALSVASQQAVDKGQPDVGLSLALEAIHMDDPPQSARRAFFQVAHSNWIRQRYIDPEVSRLDDALYHPDGQRMLTTSLGKATLWDIASGQPLKTITVDERLLHAVFHPDGHVAAIAGTNGKLYLWNIDTDEVSTLTVGDKRHNAPRFNHDGSILLTSSDDGVVNVWDWTTKERIRSFQAHDALIMSIYFSPDESQIVTAGLDGEVHVWDFATDTLLQTYSFRKAVDSPWIFSAQFLPDGERILFGGNAIPLVLWAWRSNEVIWQNDSESAGWVQDIAISPDTRTFVTALNAPSSNEPSVQQRDMATGNVLRTFRGHRSSAQSIAISPDARTMLTASSDNTAILWALQWEGILSSYPIPASGAFALDPAAPLFAAASDDAPSVIRLIDLNSGETVRSLQGHRQGVLGMAFSPDGRRLVSGDYASDYPPEDQRAYVWDVESGDLLHVLQGHIGWILDAAFSPDGRTVAISEGVGRRIILWDVETGTQVRVLEGHNDWVNAVAFSPDGRTLYSAANDGALFQWDVSTGERLRAFPNHPRRLIDLAISSDGSRIAMTSNDPAIWLLDAQSGDVLHILPGLGNNSFETVQFNPDDRRLITSTYDGFALTWDSFTGDSLSQYNLSTPNSWGAGWFSSDGSSVITTDGRQIVTWDAASLPGGLDAWVRANRYIPALTCDQRETFGIADNSGSCV